LIIEKRELTMSWSCPHLRDDICELHGNKCRPGKGQCILKGKYKISSLKDALVDDREIFLKENINKEGKK
jgi:hypothetical protein